MSASVIPTLAAVAVNAGDNWLHLGLAVVLLTVVLVLGRGGQGRIGG